MSLNIVKCARVCHSQPFIKVARERERTQRMIPFMRTHALTHTYKANLTVPARLSPASLTSLLTASSLVPIPSSLLLMKTISSEIQFPGKQTTTAGLNYVSAMRKYPCKCRLHPPHATCLIIRFSMNIMPRAEETIAQRCNSFHLTLSLLSFFTAVISVVEILRNTSLFLSRSAIK